MPRKSPNKVIRKSAAEIPAATDCDLDRLRTAIKGDIDTSEIPARRRSPRLHRDEKGRLPAAPSMIRTAVMREMRQRDLTVYRLWQRARTYYRPLSQSAVHEFLKGQRQLELPSIEALLAAVELHLVRNAKLQSHAATDPDSADKRR